MAYILALAVAISSFAMYMTAFFFPEVHRKNDFIWSGIGLFYALVLWVCAGRITGGVLLGQIGSVVLLGCFAWETLNLRWENAVKTTNVDPNKLQQKLAFLQPVINGFNWVKGLILKPKFVPEQKTPPVPTVKPPSTPEVEEKKEETPPTPEVEEKKEETPPPPKVEEKKEETPPPPKVEEKKEETPPEVDQVTVQNTADPVATTAQNEPTNTADPVTTTAQNEPANTADPLTTEETTKTNPENPSTTS
jgi:Ycf66 protein N-terminus